MSEFATYMTILAGALGSIAAIVGIASRFSTRLDSQITSPPSGSEVGGRWVSVSGTLRSRRGVDSWVAVQPSDCREDDAWWPQNHAVKSGRRGGWSVSKIRLGRELPDGAMDIGKTFTMGLFEVSGKARKRFEQFASRDDPMSRPEECRLVCSVEVRRVNA
jgi:hypothetical protein